MQVKEHRLSLEKGLVGLRIEMRKIEEELGLKTSRNFNEIEELYSDLASFQTQMKDEILVTKEETHNKFTQFKVHINEILLEFKDSVLIIQGHVDNQLLINKR